MPELTSRDWAQIPPRQVLLRDLITVTAELRLDVLLAEGSTFYGDMFGHVVQWQGGACIERWPCPGELPLDDGLHRALQAALQQRSTLHVRIARLSDEGDWLGA